MSAPLSLGMTITDITDCINGIIVSNVLGLDKDSPYADDQKAQL